MFGEINTHEKIMTKNSDFFVPYIGFNCQNAM